MPAASARKPNVLIVGGLTSVSRQFAMSLFPVNGPPLCERLRIVDKYTVHPPSTYVSASFARFCQRPGVEYRQNNLTMAERMSMVFEPPGNGRPWEYVFDFLGEISSEAPERTQVMQTFKASVNCAREAAARRDTKAYVRVTFGFYKCRLEGRLHTELDQLEPDEIRGLWWHETLRSLASIPNLPLVIIRAGVPYGPYCSFGLITRRILIGEVYRYKQRKMRYLWSPNLRVNSVHTDDIAGACWAVAEWIARVGKSSAINRAGIPFPAVHDQTGPYGREPYLVPLNMRPEAPMFNLVDASDSTQASIGQIIARYYGIPFGFRTVPDDVDCDTVAGETNEAHATVWHQLCQANDPPIEYPPLDCYVETHDLTNHASAWDGSKLGRVTGYRLRRPQFRIEAIDEIVTLFKREGVFPVVNAVDPSPDGDDASSEEDEDEEEEEGEEGSDE